MLSITVYPIPFFALFAVQGLPFPLATCVTVQAYTACQPTAYNKSRPKAAFVLFVLFYGIQIYRKETFECGVEGILIHLIHRAVYGAVYPLFTIPAAHEEERAGHIFYV